MPREDSLSSRFDYLFEPLDDGEPVDDAIDAGSPPVDSTDDDKVAPMPAPVRMAFAAFILGTLGVVAVIAVLLLQRPNEPTQPVNVPLGPAPVSATMPHVPSQGAPVAPSPAVPVPTGAPQSIESAPQLQEQQPTLQPTTESRAPQTRTTNSPATRAPISVAPESRAPFPNQEPRGDGGGGGLLGVGGLL